MSTGEKPKTDPTERSNSPDVMSSVMASAMRPSSTVKVRMLLMFSGERKLGLIDQKTKISVHVSATEDCGSSPRGVQFGGPAGSNASRQGAGR